ncbi:hypothetical protein Unana1_01165 [Umbelopsis nana]
MDDETIIRNRLAVEERPYKNLVMRYKAWTHSINNDKRENIEHGYEAILIQIAQYELAMKQHQLMHQMNEQEVKNYQEEVSKIASEIDDTQSHISKLKQDLERANEIRNNKLEYDRIAHDILQLESRDTYEKNIAQMRADIQMLQQEKAKQSAVFQNRKEQFGRLLAMVKELQTSISSERESTNEMKNIVLNMDDGFDAGSEEGSSTPAPVDTTDADVEAREKAASSHRFSERDDDADEEGMVEDGEEGV